LDPPTHVVLRSTDPRASNVAGFALVASRSDRFALLEIREDGSGPPAGDVPWRDLVPAERHMITTLQPAGGADPTGNPVQSWPIVRADRPDAVVSHLPEFLASPEAAGQALRQRLPLRTPIAILIVNGGVVARRFPDDPGATARLMKVQKQFGFSVVLAADETFRRDYSAFDYVFDVLPAPADWGSARIRCARAPPGAELRGGDEFTLSQIGGFDSVVDRMGLIGSARPDAPATPAAPSVVGPPA